MASTRNNRAQDRRAALREQQKQEKEAADVCFSLLDKEDKAREASAAGVDKLVYTVGKARAADLLGLSLAELTAYLKLHQEITETDAASDSTGEDAAASEADAASDLTGEDAAASIPAQSEAADAVAASPAAT